jgi:mannose-6-phosphate isomerase-like protein (cupin superfamily)
LVPFDCVFVAPGEPHQFRADDGEPLGFLCMVDRERDRPEPL